MSAPVAWLMLFFGFGFLFIAIRGVVRGELPTQSNAVVSSKTVRRDEAPGAFWFNFLIYFGIGSAITFFSLRAIAS